MREAPPCLPPDPGEGDPKKDRISWAGMPATPISTQRLGWWSRSAAHTRIVVVVWTLIMVGAAGCLCVLVSSVWTSQITSSFSSRISRTKSFISRNPRSVPASVSFDQLRTTKNMSSHKKTSFNKTLSWSLFSRIAASDLNHCQHDVRQCHMMAVCDKKTDQEVNCRCPQGFYFHGWKCHACNINCGEGRYLTSSCTSTSDVTCAICSTCSDTQYVAAPCSTDRDTICLDVAFPTGVLPPNYWQLSDDGREVSVAHSDNVFLERLLHMDTMETSMYVTNNQQSLDFAWPRTSGLDIAVSISEVYLIPRYQDLEAVDDTALFQKLMEPSQKMKFYYNFVQSSYCRHPLPDYYSIQLEAISNRTAAARVIRCDPTDSSLPRCPQHYKDGDRYLKWDINTPCRNIQSTNKLTPLKDRSNSVVCSEETDLLRHVFLRSRPTTQEYMFPSRDCQRDRSLCQQCLASASCSRGPTTTSPTSDSVQCCDLLCLNQTACRRTFSPDCPQPAVECATGEVDEFSLIPHFDSMDWQFACHLGYMPPETLYDVSYVIKVPSINFSTSPQHFTVSAQNRADHERKISQFDFITALHDTRLHIEDELVLVGNHVELKQYQQSLMRPYSIRNLKSPKELSSLSFSSLSPELRVVYVQFEKPFLYSSLSWYRDGCYKNTSQIYPNQSLYSEDFTPVTARKNLFEPDPSKALLKNREFIYQLTHRDRAPYVKFVVEKGKSVLQHLQGSITKGKLIANSLSARVTWIPASSLWELELAATQDGCPSVLSIKIFIRLMTLCVGHFDLLVNCPAKFSTTFKFSMNSSDLPDVFTIQINDSASSHSLVVSPLLAPLYLERTGRQPPKESHSPALSGKVKLKFSIFWILTALILIVSTAALVYNCFLFKSACQKYKGCNYDLTFNGACRGKTTFDLGDKIHDGKHTPATPPPHKYVIVLCSLLYIFYSLVFTFSFACGFIYLLSSSAWLNASSPSRLSQSILTLTNQTISAINTFERDEKSRLYASFQERRQACLHHLRQQNKKQLQAYENLTRQHVAAIFSEKGLFHSYAGALQQKNVSALVSLVQNFVSDCNKTVLSIVDRFQANYLWLLHSLAHNDWLKFPRQVFLAQDGEDEDRKFLSSTQVKQFSTWLELEKTQELLAVHENVLGRFSSVPTPRIPELGLKFPPISSLYHLNLSGLDLADHSYHFLALDSPETSLPVKTPRGVVTSGFRAKYASTQIDAQLHQEDYYKNQHPDSQPHQQEQYQNTQQFPHNLEDVYRTFGGESVGKTNEWSLGQDEGYKLEETYTGHSSMASDRLLINTLDVDRTKVLNANTIHNQTSEASPQSSTESGQAGKFKLYLLICLFLFLDVVLWVSRITWLRRQLGLARSGYPEKIPSDETCRQLLEIQGRHWGLALGQGGGRHVNGEPQVILLRDLPAPRHKDDTLQKIWSQKQRTERNRMRTEAWPCLPVRWSRLVRLVVQSPLVWQGCLTYLLILVTCVLVHCLDHWMTPQNLLVLVGGRGALDQLDWEVHQSWLYLRRLARLWTDQLRLIHSVSDSEVEHLTVMFYRTVNLQTSLVRNILVPLCQQSTARNCDNLLDTNVGSAIIGCNFLPLTARTFEGANIPHLEARMNAEGSTLLEAARWTVTVTSSLVVLLLSGRLVSRVTACTVRHVLLLSGRLPRRRMGLSEKPPVPRVRADQLTIQRSQSWVDSCESGVYLGETDDHNREECR